MIRVSERIRNRLSAWVCAHPRTVLGLVVLATLAPFLSRPFNMDDPLFIWTARHVQNHPFNPFGFDVNWYGSMEPMWRVTKNPPLGCYYIALLGALFGFSEVVLHAAFILPALAVAFGTYRLAARFCRQRLFAAMAVVFTPVFLVCSSTVMCDTLMLAFWVWAVACWVEATDTNFVWKYVIAGMLVWLAALTKYYGIALVPLLAAYSLLRARQLTRWAVGLLPPVLGMALYDVGGHHTYGRSLLSDAASYASQPTGVGQLIGAKLAGLLTALDFSGGCLAGCAFLALALLPRRTLLLLSATTVCFAALLFFSGLFLKGYGPIEGTSRVFLQTQIAFWAVGGAAILLLTATEIRDRRDPETTLLGLWIFGTFLFTSTVNWTVNGRSILPIAPAVAILVARKVEDRSALLHLFPKKAILGACATGAVLSVLVLHADYLFAVAARESAGQTFVKYGRGDARLWFQGHWGFQYYMEQLGAAAADEARSPLRRGDIVAVPINNANYSPFRPELVLLREVLSISGPRPRLLTTMKGEVGAGFYAANRGPLPFAFGVVPQERVAVLELEPPSSRNPR